MPLTSPRQSHAAADRCPGVLRMTEAADGFLARIRLPGGLISSGQLRALAVAADELGDGRPELTSRGNVQLRGLAAGAAGSLTDGLTRAGLLPSLSHDRVRNVLASPLAGLDGGRDLTGIVRALDAELCARPRLAELSGRFLFAVDDGRGDVAGLGADVVATLRRDGAVVNGLAVRCADAAPDAGVPGAVPDALRDGIVAAMLACAEAFLDQRAEAGSTAWRIADLPGGSDRVRAVVAARLGLAGVREEPGAATVARPVGLVPRQRTSDSVESPPAVSYSSDFSAVLLAPLGRLTSAQVTWVADRIASRSARITPWRSVVLPHLRDAADVLREAAGLGFGTDEASPWLRVTACAGRPGCASALADVQADAAAFAARWPGRLVHVSGCARHCGRPAATEIDVTATSEGYQIAGD
jgi:precorrin-3B synthase